MKKTKPLFFLFLTLLLSVSLHCNPEKRKMAVVINFDVEDYISPPTERIDDIPKWLAEIMTEEGVTGTFFVIGEKARSLQKRGRGDVIEAMAGHDIGSHTNFGSIHPTVTEQLESADWQSGLTLMLEQESAGIMALERIFGVTVRILARHGGSYGPQLVGALGRMNKGYAGSPVSLPGHQVVWFCNALNFTGQYDGYDNTYYRDELFEPLLEKTRADIPGLAKTTAVLPIFAGHPCKIRTEQFWDLNFYSGANPGPEDWKTPGMRPQESMKTAKKNFRRLIRFLKSRDDIEITTFSALMDRYGGQKELVTSNELFDISREILRARSIIVPEHYSPAEIFSALSESLSSFRRTKKLPPSVPIRIRPFGPKEMPTERPEIVRVNLETVFDLAEEARAFINRNRCLPEGLSILNRKIGTGSLLGLFCSAYIDMFEDKAKNSYEIISMEPYPRKYENEIVRNVEGYKDWPVHRPDLDMARIITLTTLQLWTLKPAHTAEESQHLK